MVFSLIGLGFMGIDRINFRCVQATHLPFSWPQIKPDTSVEKARQKSDESELRSTAFIVLWQREKRGHKAVAIKVGNPGFIIKIRVL